MDALFQDERLQEIYDYWQSKRRGRRAPNRADVAFAEIASLLPILQMIEVSHDPLRFRHRFAGTEIVEWMDRDATGREIDETLYGKAAPAIIEALGKVVTECRPYRWSSQLVWHERDWLVIETIELPLVDDDGRVVAILGGASFRPREPGSAVERIHAPLPLPDELEGA